MEAATKSDGKRELSGEKAQRIIDSMRASVAARGIAGSTFEHVAGEAGVSRGLLHYYFGTKERLLVEVVRRDTELRVARLDEPLAAAATVDDVLDVLISNLLDTIEHEPGVFALLFEVFSAGRRNEGIQREVVDLFRRTRDHVAGILEEKEREGAVGLPFGPGPTAAYLIAIADGIALQVLSDPDRDSSSVIEAARSAAGSLLRP